MHSRDTILSLFPDEGPSPIERGQRGRHKDARSSVSPFQDLTTHDIQDIFYRPEYQEVIATAAFERLKEIRFLGAIDYLITPNGSGRRRRHTRYQHSLRVGQLALQYARQRDLNEHDERLLVIAGLLHDAGHAPLSHSLEPSFVERFGMTHHSVSAMIIHGTVPLGSALPRIFKRYRISGDDVLALVEGESKAPYGEAFKNPINLDTIEAITRSYTYIEPDRIALAPETVVNALLLRNANDVDVLDQFWQLKDLVYNKLINNKVGILADYICRKYMQDNPLSFWKGSFLQTEPAFRRQHGKLFESLRAVKMRARDTLSSNCVKIAFQRRRFTVDNSVSITSIQDLHKRYRQSKVAEVISICN